MLALLDDRVCMLALLDDRVKFSQVGQRKITKYRAHMMN